MSSNGDSSSPVKAIFVNYNDPKTALSVLQARLANGEADSVLLVTFKDDGNFSWDLFGKLTVGTLMILGRMLQDWAMSKLGWKP